MPSAACIPDVLDRRVVREDTGDTNDRIDLQDSVVGRIIEVGGAILDN